MYIPEFHVKIKFPSFKSNWRRILGNLSIFYHFRYHFAMNLRIFPVMFSNFEIYKLKTIVKQNIWHGKKGLIKYTEANTGHRHILC
jgi:hypothetical protein